MNKRVKELLKTREKEAVLKGKMFKVWIGNTMIVTSDITNAYVIYGNKITRHEEM